MSTPTLIDCDKYKVTPKNFEVKSDILEYLDIYLDKFNNVYSADILLCNFNHRQTEESSLIYFISKYLLYSNRIKDLVIEILNNYDYSTTYIGDINKLVSNLLTLEKSKHIPLLIHIHTGKLVYVKQNLDKPKFTKVISNQSSLILASNYYEVGDFTSFEHLCDFLSDEDLDKLIDFLTERTQEYKVKPL